MKSFKRIVIGALLGSVAVFATATDAQAQPVLRTLRFIRAAASPTFDVQGVVTDGPPAPPTTATGPGSPAEIKVIVPEGSAEIAVNGQDIGRQGDVATVGTANTRSFQTPPIPQGQAMPFHITVRVNRNGQMVTESRLIGLVAGERQTIDFTGQDGRPMPNAPR